MTRIERLYAPPEIGAPGKRQGEERRRHLRLAGLFVLTMAAVAVLAIALLHPGLFGNTHRYRAYFADATGLSPGIPVLQDGYRIGLVDGVEPIFPGRDPDGEHCRSLGGGTRADSRPCFRAWLRIARDWPITSDSRALIGVAGLLQGAALKIEPGTASDLLADGARLVATGRELDLPTQLAALTDSVLVLVTDTIAPTLARIQAQVVAIEALIGLDDREGNEPLSATLDDLQQLAVRIETAIDPLQIEGILASIAGLTANLEAASDGLTGRTDALEGVIERYGDLAGEIKQVISQNEPLVARSLDDTQFVLQELAAALTPILANLEDATRNLAALARDLRANPGVIVRGRQTEEGSRWQD